METKICNKCKKELPKNTEYFYKKTTTSKLANGEYKKYYSFKNICISCWSTKSKVYRTNKLLERYSCNTIEEAHQIINNNISKRKKKYNYNERLSKAEIAKYYRDNLTEPYLVRIWNKKGVRITHEMFKKYPNIIISIKMMLEMKRGYKITKPSNIDYLLNLSLGTSFKEKRKIRTRFYIRQHTENLTDYYVRNVFYLPITKEERKLIPQEIIKAKREQIKLKRLCHTQNN